MAFDVAVTSPIQFVGNPPFTPSKIIAAGEPAFIVALVFVNPTVNVPLGRLIPPAVQLGGRTWRLTLDQLNLSTPTVTVPQQVRTATFPALAPTLSVHVFPLATPNPGPDPTPSRRRPATWPAPGGTPAAGWAGWTARPSSRS